MQKIKSIYKYLLPSFFVIVLASSANLVLARGTSTFPTSSTVSTASSSMSPSIEQTILGTQSNGNSTSPSTSGSSVSSSNSSASSSVSNSGSASSSASSSTSTSNQPTTSTSQSSSKDTSKQTSKKPTARETQQSKAFTEWLKTACLEYKGSANANCQKERIKDVMSLSHNMNVAVSKEQKACGKKYSDSGKKEECIKNSYATVAKNSEPYLGTVSEQFAKNKTYQEDIANVKAEFDQKHKEGFDKCYSKNRGNPGNINKCTSALEAQLAMDKEIGMCVAKKVLKQFGKGSKYDPAKFGGSTTKAKEAAKKDCKSEAAEPPKKSKALGNNQG